MALSSKLRTKGMKPQLLNANKGPRSPASPLQGARGNAGAQPPLPSPGGGRRADLLQPVSRRGTQGEGEKGSYFLGESNYSCRVGRVVSPLKPSERPCNNRDRWLTFTKHFYCSKCFCNHGTCVNSVLQQRNILIIPILQVRIKKHIGLSNLPKGHS